MMRKIVIPVALLFFFCFSCSFYSSNAPESSGSYSEPTLYDKFGFPVGGIYRLVDNDGFVATGFNLDLRPLVGFSCASRNTTRTNFYMHREALVNFERMQKSARDDGIHLSICSAYRDYERQRELKRRNPGKAISPGFSEHHLGTAVDLVNVRWNNRNFRWLSRNAHRYGFILTYYRRPALGVGEANHWRYVGRETAEEFYELYGDLY